MNNNWSADDFWQFSLNIYADPQVKRLCLELQNEFSLNVNLLLACAYLNACHRQLTGAQFTELSNWIAGSVDRVQAKRQQRIAAKINGADNYAQLLAQELELEKEQQDQIIAFFNQQNLTPLQDSNFQRYLNSLDCPCSADLQCMMDQLAHIITSNHSNIGI